MKDATVFCFSNTVSPSHWFRWLRRMAGFLLLCWGLCATSSFAQDCTNRSEITRSSMPPTVPFSTDPSFTGPKVLATVAYTITLTGCSGLGPAAGKTAFLYDLFLPNLFTSGIPNATGNDPTTVRGNFAMTCTNPVQCFDDTNKNFTSTIQRTGIGFFLKVDHSALDINLVKANHE